MNHKIAALVLMTLFLAGCAASRSSLEKVGESLLLKGTVLKVHGSEAEIATTYAELPSSKDSFVAELAQKVISKTLFVEGGRTEVNGVPVSVGQVGKNSLTVMADKPWGFPEGSIVRLAVPKKTLAAVDFEVINNSRSDMGRMLQEALTSELVDSGQFIMLERSKLKSVLDELKLGQSGLTREPADTEKIIPADIILTGTLTETGGDWSVNLRLVNVRTSQAIASITHKSPLFKPAELRDPSPLAEDFEGNAFPGWNLGYHKNVGDYFKVSIDRSTGAENSASSLRVEFDFSNGSMNYFANATSYAKRDLSQFKGVELYVKGDEGLNAYFSLLSGQPDDPAKIDNWIANFDITPEWRKVRIPFDSLVIGRAWQKGGAEKFGAVKGDQILRLNRVEAVRVGLKGKHIPVEKGTFWVDRITFFR